MVTAFWLSSAVEKILAELGRDGGVLLDHLGHHAAQRLDAQGQRVTSSSSTSFTSPDSTPALDRGADGHGLRRGSRPLCGSGRRIPSPSRLLHLRHAGHAADQDHVVDVAGLAGIP